MKHFFKPFFSLLLAGAVFLLALPFVALIALVQTLDEKFARVYVVNQNYPTLEQFTANMVTQLGKIELIRQPLYDYILYPTAGSAAPLAFFSVPQGGGLSSSSGNVANPKGLADTNMQLAGQLPAPQAFWVEGIEVDLQPGSSAAASTFISQVPSAFAAANAATVQAGENDVSNVLGGGVLQLNISNKPYFQEGPLYRFPPRSALALDAALASTSATAGEVVKAKLRCVGDPNRLDPGLGLMTSQFFGVTITFPTAIATPSGFNGRIGVILNGWLFRPVQ